MTLDELGSLGEFVSSIAVLITLVYLALQVKQTRRVLEANASQARAEFNKDVVLASATSPDLAELMISLNDGVELTAAQTVRVMNYATANLRNSENLHYQRQIGMLPDDIWAGADGGYTMLMGIRSFRMAFERPRPGFRPTFVAYTEDVMNRAHGVDHS
jgi:hypothetical protein